MSTGNANECSRMFNVTSKIRSWNELFCTNYSMLMEHDGLAARELPALGAGGTIAAAGHRVCGNAGFAPVLHEGDGVITHQISRYFNTRPCAEHGVEISGRVSRPIAAKRSYRLVKARNLVPGWERIRRSHISRYSREKKSPET